MKKFLFSLSSISSVWFYFKNKNDNKIKEISPYNINDLNLQLFYLSCHDQGKKDLFENYSLIPSYLIKYVLSLNKENRDKLNPDLNQINNDIIEPNESEKLPLFLFLNLFSKEYLDKFKTKNFLIFLKQWNQLKYINDYEQERDMVIHIPKDQEGLILNMQISKEDFESSKVNDEPIDITFTDIDNLEYEISKFILKCYEMDPNFIKEKEVEIFLKKTNHLSRNPILFIKTNNEIYHLKMEYYNIFSKSIYKSSEEYKKELLTFQKEKCENNYLKDFIDFILFESKESIKNILDNPDGLKDPDVYFFLTLISLNSSQKSTLKSIERCLDLQPKYSPLKNIIYIICRNKKYEALRDQIKLFDSWNVCE